MTSSTGDHLETEQKYDADAGFVLPNLGSLPELGGRRIADQRRIYLSATYFDTDDFDLLKHQVTLRRRVGGDDEGWHLKLPVRKDTRQELHAPLGEGTEGSVPARLASRVEEITAGKHLHPVAILDTERTVVRVPGPPADAQLEVADDKVTATRFDQTDCDPMTWREIEVEVLSAGPRAAAMLDTVGRALREAGARPSASGSKLARVLAPG
ncbi:MAG TPA: CYTH domain-containing protein [Streptosporangiaceae bacterium]